MPTCTPSEVKQLVIGDDYLSANGRGLTLDFCAITGFTVGTAEARMGFKDESGNTLLITGGATTDNGDGTWKATIDIQDTDSANVVAGNYDWSIEISEGGTEYTVAKNKDDRYRIKWVEKQT